MAFHPDKCNVLSITRNKTPVKYTYTLHPLEHADKAKYLGVTIQSDLKWDSYINNITTKANKKTLTSVLPKSKDRHINP